jgi:hypothetical protein
LLFANGHAQKNFYLFVTAKKYAAAMRSPPRIRRINA